MNECVLGTGICLRKPTFFWDGAFDMTTGIHVNSFSTAGRCSVRLFRPDGSEILNPNGYDPNFMSTVPYQDQYNAQYNYYRAQFCFNLPSVDIGSIEIKFNFETSKIVTHPRAKPDTALVYNDEFTMGYNQFQYMCMNWNIMRLEYISPSARNRIVTDMSVVRPLRWINRPGTFVPHSALALCPHANAQDRYY
jgi:hypothetical protein